MRSTSENSLPIGAAMEGGFDGFGGFDGVEVFGELGAGGEEGFDDGGVVPRLAIPAVEGAVDGPSKRGGVEIAAMKFEGRVVAEDDFGHLGVAVEGGPVEGGGAVLAARIDGPAGFEHHADGIGVVVLGGVGKFALVGGRKVRGKAGIFGEETFEEFFVTEFAGLGEFEIFGALIHQEAKDFVVFEIARDHVGRFVLAERPGVNRAAGVRIFHREPFAGNGHAKARRIFAQMFLDEGEIAERGSHEEIGAGAALDEVAGDFGAFANHPLRWGRFVIDVEGVDVRAVGEKVIGDFSGGSEVERRLAVASAGVDQIGIAFDELFEAIEVAQARGGVGIDVGAAFDEEGREAVIVVEHAETSGPPMTAGIDVGAVIEEGFHQIFVALMNC